MAAKKKTASKPGKRKPTNKRPTLTFEHHNLTPGSLVLMRTAVHTWAGLVTRIVEICGVAFIELADASWVASTGRYSQAIATGVASAANSEIEKMPAGKLVLIQLASVGDVVPLNVLPTATK